MPTAFLCYGNWVATTRFHGNAILGACHVRDWRHALHLLETFGSGETAVQRDVVSSWDNDGVMPWPTHSNMAMVYGSRFQDFSCFRYLTSNFRAPNFDHFEPHSHGRPSKLAWKAQARVASLRLMLYICGSKWSPTLVMTLLVSHTEFCWFRYFGIRHHSLSFFKLLTKG